MRASHARILGVLASSSAVNKIRFVWIIIVAWYEVGAFFWSVSSCSWPDKVFKSAEPSVKPTHVLIVTDTQVLDRRSYPSGRGWRVRLTQFLEDFNLRKSWNVATSFRPQAIVFLGDMMDFSRSVPGDIEYKQFYERFKSIFRVDPSVTVYYIPGNRDVGLNNQRSFPVPLRRRYASHFGPFNQRVSVGNNTFILLDAAGIVEEDYKRAAANIEYEKWPAVPKGPVEFVQRFATEGSEEPTILFSHIPLFRPDAASCGPLRERGSIRRGVGPGYQNTLGKQTSQYLLQMVRPAIIFSGDNHDYCEFTHSIPLPHEGPEPKVEQAKEVTVKAFSMARGIQRPGFHLLSLASPSPALAQSHADAPCLLPNQHAIYTARYAPLATLTLVLLLLLNITRTRRRGTTGLAPPHLHLPLAKSEGNRHGAFTRRESGIWALASPTSDRPPSPQLPPLANARPFRTPSRDASTPAFRASRPSTPLDSPLLLTPNSNAMPIRDGYAADADEEDYMDPTQYSPRPPVEESSEGSYFLPTPGPRRGKKQWSWSWAFVLRGRRRRITLSAPTSIPKISSLVGGSGGRPVYGRKRGLVTSFLADVLLVTWPPLIVYVVIAWWMFR